MIGSLKALFRATPMYLWFDDWRTRRDARGWDERDQMLLDLYGQFLRRGELCFDVGANRGRNAKVMLKLGCKVVAVEPQPHCIEILKTIYGSNRAFILEECGLSDEKGEAELMIGDVDTLSSMSTDWVERTQQSGRHAGFHWRGSVTVPLKTLDHLISVYGVPKFIKIDVEGFEQKVLAGLSQKVDFFSLEFASESSGDIASCLDYLARIQPIEIRMMEFSNHQVWSEWEPYETGTNPFARFRDNPLFAGDLLVRCRGLKD